MGQERVVELLARPNKCRNICSMPRVTEFVPKGGGEDSVVLGVDAFEVIRLLDYIHFTQEQCAARMNISRTTVTRIYEEARGKIAEAMVLGKRIVIEGGDVMVCRAMKPECRNELNCCHRQRERVD